MGLGTAHVPNRTDSLAEVASVLADAEVNIHALSVDANRLPILADAAPAVVAALADMGIAATEHRVLSVDLEDHPGRLASLAKRLATAGINIELAWGTTHDQAGTISLRVDQHDAARQLLEP
jgi:hypothetical protein